MKSIFLTASALALCLAGSAQAAIIDKAATGLSDADVTLTFDEFDGATGPVGDLYKDTYGVSFNPDLRFLAEFNSNGSRGYTPRGGHAGTVLANFVFGSPIVYSDPFSILFDTVIADVSFALGSAANANFPTTISALLNGVVVESFATLPDAGAAATDGDDDFYGFSGILFDEVVVDTGFPRGTSFDTLSYTVAAVPLPAGLPLMLVGFGLLAGVRLRHASRL